MRPGRILPKPSPECRCGSLNVRKERKVFEKAKNKRRTLIRGRPKDSIVYSIDFDSGEN